MQLKGLSGTGRDTQPLLFQPGKPGKHSPGSLRPSHAAVPRQELCNGASRAGVRGWKEVGKASTVPTTTPPPSPPPPPSRVLRGAAARSGPRSSGGPGLASPWGPPPLSGRGHPPRASWDSATGWSASGNCRPRRRWGTQLAASIAAGNSGLALSVRAPGLPAAPCPRPRQPGCPFEW